MNFTTPHRQVLNSGPMRLLRFESPAETAPVDADPVILVPSIINRPYVFDLREGQSIAAHLTAQGLTVYLIDWGDPTRMDGGLGFKDYALRLMRNAIQHVCGATGRDAVQLFGYCLGGTFSLMAAAAGVRGISGVAALTTPVDLADPGAYGLLTGEALLDVERLTAGFKVVPGRLLWASFQALDPTGNLRKARGFLERARDADFRARFKAQEGWLSDPVDMPGAALADIVDLYRNNTFARGELTLSGRPVRPADGRQPVLNLIASRDTVVPPEASRPLELLWGGPVQTAEFPGGHLGVAVGSKAPENMWKVAAEWFAAPKESCHA